jgi:O-antigen ligase
MNDRLSAGIMLSLMFAVLTAWITEPGASYAFYAIVFAWGAAWSIARLIHPVPVCVDPMVWVLCSVPVWGLVQLGFGLTVNRWQTLNSVLLWFADTMLFFFSTQLFAAPARRDHFLRRLLWFGVVLSVVAVFQLYTSHGRVFWVFQTGYSGFIMGPFLYHNHFIAFVALILPFALHLSQRDRSKQPLYAALVAILTGSVLASASRSGAILIGLEITVALIVAFRRTALSSRGRIVRVTALICIILLSGVISGWSALWGRFHEGDAVRLKLAQSSMEMIQSAPWTGSGLGTWSSAYPMHAHFDDGLFVNQAHSDWLQWTSEGGLPLLVVMLYVAATLAVPAVRSVWGIGVPVVFAQCLVDYPLQKPAVCATFFVVAGALRAAAAHPRARNNTYR